MKCWEHSVQLIPSCVTLLPPTLPTSFGDPSADFSCCFWVSHAAPNRLKLSLLPLASPLSSSWSDWEALKCSHPHHYLLLASQSSGLLNTCSQIPTQLLTPLPFVILQVTFTVSLPLNFLSLPFPVKPAITSSFLSLPLFLVDWRWIPSSTPVYF